MKRKLTMLPLLLLCLVLLVACGKGENGKTPEREVPGTEGAEMQIQTGYVLPEELPKRLAYSSGAGAWSTTVDLARDGAFTGVYSDSNLGEFGEGYLATVYTCTFSGRFTEIEKIDEYSFRLHLGEIVCDRPAGEEWIDPEQVRYVSSVPYGLEDGTEFVLYLPQTPVEGLDEEFLSWWPHRFSPDGERPAELGFYGLRNVKMGYGFFG